MKVKEQPLSKQKFINLLFSGEASHLNNKTC